MCRQLSIEGMLDADIIWITLKLCNLVGTEVIAIVQEECYTQRYGNNRMGAYSWLLPWSYVRLLFTNTTSFSIPSPRGTTLKQCVAELDQCLTAAVVGLPFSSFLRNSSCLRYSWIFANICFQTSVESIMNSTIFSGGKCPSATILSCPVHSILHIFSHINASGEYGESSCSNRWGHAWQPSCPLKNCASSWFNSSWLRPIHLRISGMMQDVQRHVCDWSHLSPPCSFNRNALDSPLHSL